MVAASLASGLIKLEIAAGNRCSPSASVLNQQQTTSTGRFRRRSNFATPLSANLFAFKLTVRLESKEEMDSLNFLRLIYWEAR